MAAVAHSLWPCAIRPCDTGQTSSPRVGTGRKFVSDFFGRNKKATATIPEDVWHYICRQHYQRQKYASEKSTAAYLDFHLGALTAQLQRIQIWRPMATFTVQLQTTAKNRLNKYRATLQQNGGDQAAAARVVAVTPKAGKKNAAIISSANAVDPRHAAHIQATFAGQGRSCTWILTRVIPWIDQEIRAGRMDRMPPIEFLIAETAVGEQVSPPQGNWAAWNAAHPVNAAAAVAPPAVPAAAAIPLPPTQHTAEELDAAKTLLDLFSSAPLSSTAKATKTSDLPLYVPPPPILKKQSKQAVLSSAPPTSVLDLPHVPSIGQSRLPPQGWRKYRRRAVYIRGMLFSKATTRFWHPDLDKEYENWVGEGSEPETEEDEVEEEQQQQQDLPKLGPVKRKRGNEDDDGLFSPKTKLQKRRA